MKQVQLQSVHKFRKVNLVTLKDGTDQLKCSKCGIIGKRRGFNEYIMVPDRISDEKIKNCDGSFEDEYLGKWCKITRCNVGGGQFTNIIPESQHQIITPPEGYLNGDRGIWVQGIDEPVKILFGEFKIIDTPDVSIKEKDPDDWFHEYWK